jgi:hypothetical protein
MAYSKVNVTGQRYGKLLVIAMEPSIPRNGGGPRARGIAGMTHCKRGHDLRLPDAIAFDRSANKRQCAVCLKARNSAKYEAKRKRDAMKGYRTMHRSCTACGMLYGKPSANHKCWLCKKVKTVALPDTARADMILALQLEKERAMTPWGRAEVQARMDALLARPRPARARAV